MNIDRYDNILRYHLIFDKRGEQKTQIIIKFIILIKNKNKFKFNIIITYIIKKCVYVYF